jgi:hypothetical protein
MVRKETTKLDYFLAVVCDAASLLNILISRTKSEKASSTLILDFAEVSKNGTFHWAASSIASCVVT